jgi:N,N'-diacetyllegionaminate synthase
MIDAEISLGTKVVAQGRPSYVIAEIGSNHDQSIVRARSLIEAAAEAGANAVKFQLYRASDLVPLDHSAYGVLVATELSEAWIPELASLANECGMGFLASAFSTPSVQVLETSGIVAHKIASSEVLNIALLRQLALSPLPVLMSIGMCSWADVESALEVLQSGGKRNVIPLQCISMYPLPIERANLRVIPALLARYRGLAGFSDHTESVASGAYAVALGATVIEKHITWSRSATGPDHCYALEPQEFREYCGNIREVEAMLGGPERIVEPEERGGRRRMGLVVTRDLAPGDELRTGDLAAKGPFEGIPASYLSALIGSRVRASLAAGDRLDWAAI